jgi:protein-tyrosine kinase
MGMNQKVTPPTGSLIERAAEIYDFNKAIKAPVVAPAPITPVAVPTEEPSGLFLSKPGPSSVTTLVQKDSPSNLRPAQDSRRTLFAAGPTVSVDRKRLRASGFIVPDSAPRSLAEEFRIVKRQLLLNASGAASGKPLDRGRMILVCSAQPNDGKTFCAVNLALSLASERDTDVLLVDADVAKPEILSTLGIEGGPGLMDALEDPSIDVESLIISTDIPKLSVLAAGRQANNDTEMLASARTKAVLDGLADSHPSRIIIFDSAPALAASPASVLALNVGQVVMVVRADRTTESELRDALALVDGCPNISLLLNGSSYFGSNHSFGSYYGQGE